MADGTNLQNTKMSSLEDGPEGDTKVQDCSTVQKVLFVIFVVLFITLSVVGIVYCACAEFFSQNECTSTGCVTTASRMAMKMDRTADPCYNFAQYACGGFYRDTIIPDDRNAVTSFTLVNDKNELVLRRILESKVKPDDKGFVKKMKTFYKNCMDVETIERIGVTPYTDSKFAKQWPTLNSGWDAKSFNLNDAIVEYEREFVEPIFIYTVFIDLDDSSKHKLHLEQGGLGLPQEYMLKFARNDASLMAFQKYYQDIAIELGAQEDTAKQDAQDMVDFEVELARIMVTREEMIDISTMNNPTTLRKMTRDYPFIDFHRAIQAAFDSVHETIPKDLPIINRHPKYFNKLKALLDATDKRTIMNRFGFQYAKLNVGSLTKRMRAIRDELKKVLTGKKEADPRWRTCISETSFFIEDAVGKVFVNQTFSEDSKKYMGTMIVNLKKSFEGLLTENQWMDTKTKQAAFQKLDRMGRKIGYPDNNYSNDYIEKKYENYTVYAGEHYKTFIEAYRHKNMEGLRELGKEVDKEKWLMIPSKINAYYDSTMNEIVFPAGILQAPFFSKQAPSSVNYGAIGGIIGHEITHGFDQSGSQFDYKGNLKNWWQPKAFADFKNRTQCVIDHYANFEVEEIKMKLNGEITAGENVADIGGVKESFRAYKAYAATKPKELPLPRLGLSTHQQFFLAFAQNWCAKTMDAELKNNVLSDVHPPGRFRIIGPFQNNEEFLKAYNCPVGSPMNPAKKCVVW